MSYAATVVVVRRWMHGSAVEERWRSSFEPAAVVIIDGSLNSVFMKFCNIWRQWFDPQ
jgi:hypothetical protein